MYQSDEEIVMLSGLTKLMCPIHTTVLLSEAKDPRAKRSAPQVPHGCRQLLVCAARNGFAGGCFALLSMTGVLEVDRFTSTHRPHRQNLPSRAWKCVGLSRAGMSRSIQSATQSSIVASGMDGYPK